MKCSSCGKPTDRQPNGKPPPCPDPRHVIKPQRGVAVLQPGCGDWDHYTKKAFREWLGKGAFPVGTVYRIGADEFEVGK